MSLYARIRGTSSSRKKQKHPANPVSNEAELKKARVYALKVSNFRPRSAGELKEKLRDKGFSQETADAVISEFAKKGILNDFKFAKLWVESRLHSNPKGAFLLRRELSQKGVEDEVIDQAVRDAAGERSEYETVKTLAESRMAALRGLDAATVKRRLFGYLKRRGFETETIIRVIKEIRVDKEK
jgi:regulatory protein